MRCFFLAPMSRPRVLVLNQYYWPGVEATAHLLSQLCAALAEDFEVTVVTGRLRDADGAGRLERDGVEIRRVPSTAFGRRRLALRALNYLTYLGSSLAPAMATRPPDVVLCMTDPPVIGDVALLVARRFQVPLVVISQDVFPEVAVELKRLENPVVVRLLGAAIGAYVRRADPIVALGGAMGGRLERKGADPRRIQVIPNWGDTQTPTPPPPENERGRAAGPGHPPRG